VGTVLTTLKLELPRRAQLVRFGLAVLVDRPLFETERVKASPFDVHCSPKLRGLLVGAGRLGRGARSGLLRRLLIIADPLRGGRKRGTG
jgi:hypothetical protein